MKDVYEDKELTLTDFISVDMLQKIQDAFSEMTGMAALITDRYGVPVTVGSNFTDFCMTYTRQSAIGRSRCEQCDKKGAESAYQSGKPCIYECHAGLMDYAAPIKVNGEMIGCFIGGQVLPEKTDSDKYRRIAEEIQVDSEEYVKALESVYILEREKINTAANFLYVTANVLSEIAYNKHQADVSNALLLEKNKQLDFYANYDRLTGLSNRHHISGYFQQYKQSGQPYCVILGDIDNFKSVNDTYGHECGDLVLAGVADTIKNNLPDTAVPCRWGGEEFLVLMYGEEEDALCVMEGVCEKIRQREFCYNSDTIHVSMTFGVVSYMENPNPEKLTTIADKRLYFGKKHGKNQVVGSGAEKEQ